MARTQYDTSFKKWRQKCSFTQQEAADKLGISKSHAENYDKGLNRSSKQRAIPSYAERVLMTLIAQDKLVTPWPE